MPDGHISFQEYVTEKLENLTVQCHTIRAEIDKIDQRYQKRDLQIEHRLTKAESRSGKIAAGVATAISAIALALMKALGF